MKRILSSTTVMSLLSISSIVNAASTLVPMDQPVPTRPTYELTIGALFLQPSSTLLDYAVHGFPFPTQSPHWNISAINPGYSTGFDLAGRYNIPNSRYDVHLSWDHLRTSDSDSTQAGPSEFVVVLFQAGPSAGQDLNNPSTFAAATATFAYDVVHLDVGRTFDYDDNTQLRLYTGLSAARIKQNLSATFRDNAETFSVNQTNNSKFTGIGPLIGLDGKYLTCFGLGIFGSAIVSGLIGTLDPLTTFTSSSPELAASGITTNYQNISPTSSTQVVPAVEAKLGLDYKYAFDINTIFTVALGYEYAVYFNSIAIYSPSTVFGNVNLGTIALSSLQKSVSNFNVQGPFLNFTVGFA